MSEVFLGCENRQNEGHEKCSNSNDTSDLHVLWRQTATKIYPLFGTQKNSYETANHAYNEETKC